MAHSDTTLADSRVVKPKSNGTKTAYLVFYNSVSAALWAIILSKTVTTLASSDSHQTFREAGEFTKWTQTLAGLEILHAAFGVVRAPLLTTVMQVASRFLLVWGIAHNFPAVASSSLAYSTMLLAWSTTEIIRYGYFAFSLAFGSVPAIVTWLRYNAFFILYPLGISSECWLIWLSQEPARKRWNGSEWILRVILLVYIPGSYILFTHMMAQRRKIMRTSGLKKSR